MSIATADFRINGTTNYGKELKDVSAHLELSESGVFAYGNQTCVMMVIGNGQEQVFDTRYDTTLRRDGANFKSWAAEFLKDYLSDGLTATEA